MRDLDEFARIRSERRFRRRYKNRGEKYRSKIFVGNHDGIKKAAYENIKKKIRIPRWAV